VQQRISPVSISSAEMFGTLSLSVRSYYSSHHVQAAALFARSACAIEQHHPGGAWDDAAVDHRAYVTGSVISSVAFLEALINELFLDAAEHHSGHYKVLGRQALNTLGGMWEYIERQEILGKFQVALLLLGKPPFAKGQAPYQDAQALVLIRNALVHYRPESRAAGDEADANLTALGKKLTGKFPLNPLTGKGNSFFPDKCLGHGCAAWSVRTSVALADEFFAHLGCAAPYQRLRPRLLTE
jgi:hypothetical protein